MTDLPPPEGRPSPQHASRIPSNSTLERHRALTLSRDMDLHCSSGETMNIGGGPDSKTPEILLREGSEKTGQVLAKTRLRRAEAEEFCICESSSGDELQWSEYKRVRNLTECVFDVPCGRRLSWNISALDKPGSVWVLKEAEGQKELCKFTFASRLSKGLGGFEWVDTVSRHEELAGLIVFMAMFYRIKYSGGTGDGFSTGVSFGGAGSVG